jgi:hypothetical protein
MMSVDDLVRELYEIRLEVQKFAAIQSLARLDAEISFQGLINRIDSGIVAAQRQNIQDLLANARGRDLTIEELNTDRGRYFGAVLAKNETAILASFKSNTAHIIPKAAIHNMIGSAIVGSQINVAFESGMCSITVKH